MGSDMTLTEFLLARIAEDEDLARQCGGESWVVDDDNLLALRMVKMTNLNSSRFQPSGRPYELAGSNEAQTDHIALHDPARVLAECEAKRRIVAIHERGTWSRGSSGGAANWCEGCGGEYKENGIPFPCPTLSALASVYADHPDHQQEWTA